MTIHLVKLCVGADFVDDLRGWIEKRVAYNQGRGWGRVHDHVTRMTPRRRDDLLAGGSIYWIIAGSIRCRQRVLDLKPSAGADGVERCAILLDPALQPTELQPRRPFQGWRYLTEVDAPADAKGDAAKTPEALRLELAELGLI